MAEDWQRLADNYDGAKPQGVESQSKDKG
jgi:hypothetical protein